MARSGQAAAVLLNDLGANITITDKKTDLDFDYKSKGIEAYLGKNPDDIVQNFDLIIISPGISIYTEFVQKAEHLGIPVWGEAELAYRLCPCYMVAITGTNGKTTVTTLVGEILKKINPGTVIAGNIGIPFTGLVNNLTPSNIVVAEISSFQLETIEAFRPKISCVLNMTPDHLDRHKTMENYIAMKSRIFQNQRQDDVTVLNYDNVITKNMRPVGRVVYFSVQKQLESGVYLKNGMIVSRLDNNEENQVIHVSETSVLPENACAATALALLAGASIEHVACVLKNFRGVAHRLEHITTINGVDYYNDSKATNTDAAIKALTSFNRPVVLIAGGSDKESDFTQWVEYFNEKVLHLILIGQTANKIIETCNKLGYKNYEKADTLEEAVNRAKSIAKHGQKVLFSPACASFDMFKDFEERGDLFKAIVKGVSR